MSIVDVRCTSWRSGVRCSLDKGHSGNHDIGDVESTLVRQVAELSAALAERDEMLLRRDVDVAQKQQALRELQCEVAGMTGELLGMKVTAGFFQSRCEVLEKLLNNERLTEKEQEVLVGCCPLHHPAHTVCRGCGLTLEEYEAEHARLAALKAKP